MISIGILISYLEIILVLRKIVFNEYIFLMPCRAQTQTYTRGDTHESRALFRLIHLPGTVSFKVLVPKFNQSWQEGFINLLDKCKSRWYSHQFWTPFPKLFFINKFSETAVLRLSIHLAILSEDQSFFWEKWSHFSKRRVLGWGTLKFTLHPISRRRAKYNLFPDR